MLAIDFFCGAGGLTKGLQMAGIDVVAGIDLDASCSLTYDINNEPSEFYCADIYNIQPDDLFSLVPALRDNPDDVLFAGCAPCQNYSQQRKAKYARKDATILSEFGRLIQECLPGHVIMENVPGITKVKGFSVFRRFVKLLKNNGYSVEWRIVDAKDYGVPQNRKRLVLIASRNGNVSIPPKTHGKELQNYLCVRDAIERFPAIDAGERYHGIPNHISSEVSELNLVRLRNTPHNGGDRRSWPEEIVLDCHSNGYEGHTDTYGRMFWDNPAPTLTGRCHSISNGRYGHPEQDRALSLREAAAIQTFPDNYKFYGSKRHIALQIGNAVPVQLGRVLGEHIVNIHTSD